MNLFDLTGKRALVTGGARGLGRGMAEALRDAGATVAIVARTEGVYRTAEEVGFLPVQADLVDRAQVDRAFEEGLAALGGIDVLITSHGATHRVPGEDMPIEEWDRVIEVNLTSVFRLIQLAGRVMLAQGSGKVITVASMLSFSGGLYNTPYASSKGGVAQLTKAFANEWAGRGVNVNSIAPGYMATDFTRALQNDATRAPRSWTASPPSAGAPRMT